MLYCLKVGVVGERGYMLLCVCVFFHQVVTPGNPLGPGQIYDSNRSTLLASLSEQGFPAADLGIAVDDRESLVRLIEHGLAENDVLITSGGVSMGEKVNTHAIVIVVLRQ